MLYKDEIHMDLEQLTPVHTIKEHTDSIDAITINPVNNIFFATGSHDKTIKIWDINKVKCVKTSQADR